jgi:hypothetical protein
MFDSDKLDVEQMMRSALYILGWMHHHSEYWSIDI